MHLQEEQPIFNIQAYANKKSKQAGEEQTTEILSWNKKQQCVYLRGVFDSAGKVFFSTTGEKILVICHSSDAMIELYRQILQSNNIHSLIYPAGTPNEDYQLLIVGDRDLQLFEQKIGCSFHSEIDLAIDFLQKSDWED